MTDLRMSLNGFKTRNSLLFVFSPSDRHHVYRIQKELFADSDVILREQGLIVAEIFEQGNSHIGDMELGPDSCDYLRRLFNVNLGDFKVLLLSKEQQIKLMADSFVSERELLMRLECPAERLEAAVE
ncbi:MAG: DUF4174 domain-containing protein [Sedimentisphaerales bacterium]|nr:DUF4174 domain-containing protein [Sedimentisphaerales bacterium]